MSIVDWDHGWRAVVAATAAVLALAVALTGIWAFVQAILLAN